MPPDLEPPPSPRAFKINAREGALPNDLAIRSTFAQLGAVKSLHRTADGVVVTLSTKNRDQTLAISSIKSVPVTCEEATSSKGTIYLSDFSSCTNAEIQEELPAGTSLLRRLPSRRDAEVGTSGRILLEFKLMTPPEFITLLCGLRLEVREHTPAPLRCRTCLTYGHHERTCDKEPRCGNCSGTGHVVTDCTANPKCTACGGPHAVTSTACRTWQTEREVNKIRISRNINSSEALKLVNKPRPHLPTVPPAAPVPAAPAPALTQSWASVAAGTQKTRPSQSSNSSDMFGPLISIMQQQTQMMTMQLGLLTELKKQNESILSLLSGLTHPPQPSSSGTPGRAKRPRTSTATTATPPTPSHNNTVQLKIPQLIHQSQPRESSLPSPVTPTVISLGRDTTGSPSSENAGTYDLAGKN